MATVAFDLAFVYPSWSSIPLLWYYPLARRWSFEPKPHGLAMDWYGRTLLAIVVGTLVFVIAQRIGRLRRSISESSLALWASWVAIATVLAMSLQVFQLANRHPTPEPLPSWYVPK